MAVLFPNSDVQSIDDRKFYFRIVLVNADGDSLSISKSAVVSIILEDDMLDVFHKGAITIQNNEDILERGSKYRFRGDGRDVLALTIEPDLGSGSESLADTYRINMTFSIYDEENIITKHGKYKKYYFRDVDEQVLRERVINYTTVPNQKSITQRLSNRDRAKSTGMIIQDILQEGLGKDKVKVDAGWDEGAGSIFYSSPGPSKAWDDLQYVLSYHTSKKYGDICIFRKERDDNIYSLASLSEYFRHAVVGDKMGPVMLERYVLSQASSNDALKTNAPKTDAPYIADLNTISQYELLHPSAEDVQSRLITTIVTNHDGENFNIDMTANFKDLSTSHFNRLYTNGITKTGTGNYANNLTKTSNDVLSIVNSHQPSKNVRFSDGYAKVLRDYVFLNQGLEFTLKGSTHRRSGRFVEIASESGRPNDNFDSFLLGVHLIVRITHEFTNNDYKNTITCIKPYQTKNLKQTDKA